MAIRSRPAEPLVAITDVLIKTLRTLGQKGYPDAANRLAAQAWLALRDEHPRDAERINGAMHYLARLPETPAASAAAAPTAQEDTAHD